MITEEIIFERIQRVLVESFEIEKQKITLQAHLYEDLDLDSLDAIDLAVQLSAEANIKLEEEEMKTIRTIGDIVKIGTKALVDEAND